MADEFIGSWTSIACTNEDKLMEAMGVPAPARAILKSGKHCLHISKDGDKYVMKTENAVKAHEVKFNLGQEFDEKIPDGREFKTTITVDGGKWKMERKPKKDGKSQCITCCRKGDELHAEASCDGVTGTRIFKKA